MKDDFQRLEDDMTHLGSHMEVTAPSPLSSECLYHCLIYRRLLLLVTPSIELLQIARKR